MLVIKLALRNLFHNRRRTILSLWLIALGVAALFLFRGFSEDVMATIKDSAIDQIGHLQIATEAWVEGDDYLISPEVLAQVKEILLDEPQVICYSTRLDMRGLIGTELKSVTFGAIGVEPAGPVPDIEIKEGRRLEAGDREAVLLTPELAEELGVGVGDYLTVRVITDDGILKIGSVNVFGVFRLGGITGRAAIAPVSFVQMMRDIEHIATIAVILPNDDAKEEVALRLQGELEGLELKVRTWREAMHFYNQVGLFLDSIFGFVGLVIFLIVLFSVLEGLTMAFFERIREVGAVRAIGTRRHQIFGMFLIEGVLLGLFSGVVGIALAWGIGALINIAGLTWVHPATGSPMPFRITLGLDIAWMPFLVALGATTISAVYPAYRAAKLEIASALRFV